LTADKLVENTANSTHILVSNSPSLSSGSFYTCSVYAKAAERTRFAIQIGTGSEAFGAAVPFAIFDVSNGTTSSVSSATANMVFVGDGWYRCTLTTIATTTTAATAVRFKLATVAGDSYTGDGTSGLFIWGAQLSDSASLDPYVYNPAAAPASTAYYGPRFDYDPVTLAARGLLIEEQRTNSIRNNTMVGAVAGTPGTLPTNWVMVSLSGLTQEIVSVGSAAGINYIDIKVSGTTTSASNVAFSFDGATSIAASSGQTWAGSSYFAIVGGGLTNVSSAVLRVIERTGAGAFVAQTDSDISAATSSLSRFSATRTLGATAGAVQYGILLTIASGVAIDITLRIGLPQLELGAFATSVIPTSTAAATRAADVATMVGDNFANWFNAVEGTLFADAQSVRPTTDTTRILCISDTTANNSYRITATNTAVLAVVTAGATEATASPSYVANAVNKYALAYKANDFAATVNGASPGTDTSVVLPVVNQMELGVLAAGASGSRLCGHIRRIAFINRRVSNAELQAISQ
jgi:hypothetical protein